MVESWLLESHCTKLTSDRDQTAVNGAQIYFKYALGIKRLDRLGLVVGAPYLCCALSCCFNYPLNKWFGRRGVILITCLISSVTCLLQAFSQNWWHLFLSRFALGFGIGLKSATIPIYVAEASPENIRGALVMSWQMWTAFGIMCGYLSGVALASVGGIGKERCQEAFAKCKSDPNGACPEFRYSQTLNSQQCSLNWRMMLASPVSVQRSTDHIPLTSLGYLATCGGTICIHITRVSTCAHSAS
jgi:MFS family permease